MNTIIHLGEQGAEHVDVAAPNPPAAVSGAEQFLPIIERFPTTSIQSETNDGTQRGVEAHMLAMDNPQVFDLVWQMAPYEPTVYAQQGGRVVMGMLSPNFDEHGVSRLPTVKVLPLQTPYPLIRKGADLLPDANMATMLAGSAHAEGLGSGGHDKPPSQDFEHKITRIGAISLGKNTITEGGVHVQHAVRRTGSVATGLTNGSLGNVYVPNGESTAGFTGYDAPMTFQKGAAGANNAIYFPKGFLNNPEAYGVCYPDASRIAYGAALQILHDRQGQSAVSEQIRQMDTQA